VAFGDTAMTQDRKMGAMRFGFVLVAAALLAPSPARAEDDHPLGRAQEILDRVAPLIEKACGAKFDAPPRVVALSEISAAAVFAKDMRPEFDRRYPDLPETARAGMIARHAEASVRSCLARYSFDTRNVIVVREGFDRQCAALKVEGDRRAQLLLVTLAHECVHALDDARFGLAKLYRGVADDEALRAVAMTAEGRAVHFGRIAAAEAGAPRDLVELLPGGETPKGAEAWHANLTYRLGARFIAALVERGGTALADKALASPPALTWSVCAPSRWPDGAADPRPAKVLARAGLADATKPLSELQLLERYADLSGLDAAERLFAAHAGGSVALDGGTNCAVLAFADEDAAKRFEEVSRAECPTARRGTLVARALGGAQDAVLERLAAALAEPARESR
jgi:hypothetical protein